MWCYTVNFHITMSSVPCSLSAVPFPWICRNNHMSASHPADTASSSSYRRVTHWRISKNSNKCHLFAGTLLFGSKYVSFFYIKGWTTLKWEIMRKYRQKRKDKENRLRDRKVCLSIVKNHQICTVFICACLCLCMHSLRFTKPSRTLRAAA